MQEVEGLKPCSLNNLGVCITYRNHCWHGDPNSSKLEFNIHFFPNLKLKPHYIAISIISVTVSFHKEHCYF